MTVFQRITSLREDFTAVQQRIGDFILENYKKSAFLNSTDLATQVGVSNPTVIRFAKALGYKGYREFQTELQNTVQNELSALERHSYFAIDPEQDTYSDIFSLEIENLRTVSRQLDRERLHEAVSLLQSADTVYVFGKQISQSVAMFASYTLGKIMQNVRLVDQWSPQDEAAYNAAPDGCCALVVALPRYPVATMEFLHFLHRRGIPAVVITGEGSVFPEQEKAACLLPAPVRYFSFIDPISSVFCLINSIAVDIIKQKGQSEIEALSAFERYVTDCRVYVSGTDTDAVFSSPVGDGVE